MSSVSLALRLVVVLLAAAVFFPVHAGAQQQPLVPLSLDTVDQDKAPPLYELSPNEARAIAQRLPEVREVLRDNDDVVSTVQIPLYLGPQLYEVFYTRGDKGLADIVIDGRTAAVEEVWTGPQADFPLARGTKPPIGGSLNSPWIWLTLSTLFVLPFFDPRRPFRILHLDLLVLLGFGVSLFFFNRGDLDLSVPLVYPFLLYLLVRLGLAGFRPQPRDERLVPFARVSWLAVGLVLLVAFRLVLNVVDSSVIDVGYASVVGANRIANDEELYVSNAVHGDTYGPINYIAYIPFELLFPDDGLWGDVPAAHAAAIAFDLVTIMGLMLLGARLRPGGEGRRLGLALAFAWVAYPFTAYSLQANGNDALIAMLLVLALLALRSAPGRGALLGLGAAAKFAPLALAPLLATGIADRPRLREWTTFSAALVGVIALAVLLYLPDGGLREFYDATLGFQLGRSSPFSLWGLHESLAWVGDLLALGALGFAGLVAFVPRHRDLRIVAALGAAVMVAIQLPAIHWFYFYLVWIAPLALLAMLGGYRWPVRGDRWTNGLGPGTQYELKTSGGPVDSRGEPGTTERKSAESSRVPGG